MKWVKWEMISGDKCEILRCKIVGSINIEHKEECPTNKVSIFARKSGVN